MTAVDARAPDDIALVDLIDRLIDGGVVLAGDVVLSVADVDLVYLGLRVVLAPAHEIYAGARTDARS